MSADRFSDLRVLRWHDRITSIVKDHEQLGPIRANLDLTNLCNDACPWCEPLDFRKATIADSNHTMDTDVVLSVLQDLGDMDCKTVNFSGGGEPLIHTDFGTILRFSVRQGMRAWIVTNGAYIDKWMGDLQYAHHVRVSLDASNEAEHMEMHGSKAGEFQKVCENIRNLCNNRSAIGRPEVGISYLLSSCNDKPDSLQRIYAFSCDAGVDFIHFRPLSESTPERGSKWPIEVMKWCDDNLTGKTQILTGSKRLTDVFQQRQFRKCYAALTLAVIGANGDVAACCDRRDIVFGNCNEQSFKSIWLNARHQRKAAEIVPALCSRCLMCGFNKAVESYIIRNDSLPELL